MNKISGLYKIVNKTNGKFYVGSTTNIIERFYNHRSQLNRNIHDNLYLQRSWNKYGKDNFDFIILKECEEKDLITEEQKELNTHFGKDYCYNLSPSADVSMRGIPRSKEVKLKISLAQKGKPRLYARGNKWSLGRKHKPETIERFKGRKSSFENIKKAQESNIGRVYTKECCSNISKGKLSKHKKFDDVERERIRTGVQKAIQEGRYHKNKVPSNEYENIKLSYLSGETNQRKLALKYGVNSSSMSKLLKKLGVK